MHHTEAFFSYVFQQRGPIAMGKKNNGVKGEREPMPEDEQKRRIERAVTAIKAGCGWDVLVERGFKPPEIKKAQVQAMIGKK
jgi:hypothetical protein